MSETTTTAAPAADPCDTVLDAAAVDLSGLTMLQAADHSWESLLALAGGTKAGDVEHHRAVVMLACNIKALRD